MTSSPGRRVEYYGLVRPRAGERHAGDAAVLVELDGSLLAAIVDGLGHGREAHDVAVKAAEFLNNGLASSEPVDLLRGLHATLKGTRGAAVGLGVLDTGTGLMRYAGVGNVVMRRFGTACDRLVSVDGVVGGTLRTPREQRMMLGPRDTVVMYSDGVRDRFDLSDYPQLVLQDARTVARTVMRFFARDYDDASCIAMRYAP
jgi:serine phosphatase RsbU (regulator of sigma subunit)